MGSGPAPGTSRAHVCVEGRVQGVFFRDSVRACALRAGVRGWVRNLPDGRVEAVLEGDEPAVRDVVAFMRDGPPGARVVDVQISWEQGAAEFPDFRIRR